MEIADFRRIALSLEGAEESSHMGSPDFRVGGHIFATLAAQGKGLGNLMLTPEQQAAFVEDAPEIFLPIAGGWGRMGATHIRLSRASEEILTGALRCAWRLRKEKNERATPATRAAIKGAVIQRIAVKKSAVEETQATGSRSRKRPQTKTSSKNKS